MMRAASSAAVFGFFDDQLSALGVADALWPSRAPLPVRLDALFGGGQIGLAAVGSSQPSAIFLARSSSALINGGHTNFIVNRPG
jgi:hypothetical protein